MGLLEAHTAMAGKVAVVVGGGAGFIGRAVSLGLAKAGVHLIVCDNDAHGLRQTAAEIEELGGSISAHVADVTEAAALDAFWDLVAAETPHIDMLVNVPGGVRRALFPDTGREDHARD